MSDVTTSVTKRAHKSEHLPSYVLHMAFDQKPIDREFMPEDVLARMDDFSQSYMPDDVTRDYARRMHYAAHRMHTARRPNDLAKWRGHYLALRDHIVLGNRKLIYRAVRRRMAGSNRADDMIGDCHIVLIQAVAAFNPWLGIRFSTYAYTCLVRALSRLCQKLSVDWAARSASLDVLPDGEPGSPMPADPSGPGQFRLDEYLRTDHPLLTLREKAIISRRFSFGDDPAEPTLEMVGKAMGLSKERVRQVQASALDKLRAALLPEHSAGG